MADKLFDLGSNGVTRAHAYEEDGEIIIIETQSGEDLDAIVAANQREAEQFKGKMRERGKRGDLGVIGARIPIVRHHVWRQEWKNGPKKWGVPWHRFLKQKLNSSEFSKLRFMKI